jgi:hypothetical protein
MTRWLQYIIQFLSVPWKNKDGRERRGGAVGRTVHWIVAGFLKQNSRSIFCVSFVIGLVP